MSAEALSARWEQLTRLNVPDISILRDPIFVESHTREGACSELVSCSPPLLALHLIAFQVPNFALPCMR
jgi:hypothetical protein